MARLGDVCKKGSSNITQKDLEGHSGNYPIFGASGFITNVDFYQQEKPYIAVIKDGAGIGRIMKLPEKSSIIGTMQYIIPNDTVDISYLAYAMEHMDLAKYFTGATIPHIYFKDYQKEELPLPILDEQRKIAAVLDKVSDLLAKCRQQLDKLDLLIKSHFVEMFYNTMDNANWPIVTMADISTDMRTGPFGSALHHDEFVETGVFVLGIDNAVENRFSYNRMRYITEEKYQQLKRYTVRPGDVIITIMGTVGRSAVIPDNIPKAINTKHLACLTIDRSKAQPTFICSAFQMHPEIRQQLTGQAKGAIMDGLNLTIIKKLCFKLPPIEMQNKFVEFFNLTENTKTPISRSLEKLETLKKALMQKYFG